MNEPQTFALRVIAVALSVLAATSVFNLLADDGDRIAQAQVEATDRQVTAVRAACVANARTRIPESFTPQAFDSELQLLLTVCMTDAAALSEFVDNALSTIRERINDRASP